MNYWLMKTEPNTYSWDDLVRDTKKKGSEQWDGIRNYEARNNMKKMEIGDEIFMYHSVKEKAIVGIATVVATAHPDSTDDTDTWECVDIAAKEPFAQPISLEQIKNISALAEMVLVKRNRLSVQPVTAAEWKKVLQM